MCRFAAPLAFNFMAALAIPPSSRHSQGDRDVQDTVRPAVISHKDLTLTNLSTNYTQLAPSLWKTRLGTMQD